ncbi:MAG TPA: glycosyltransferase [Cyclobacteriaceae bacterium]|nr:glycosyltransferase [Cyclobacteriaceae bacterium]
MAELLNIILGVYCLLVFVLLIGWLRVRRQPMPPRSADGPGISLIIALRNEEQNLAGLVRDLSIIAYPPEKFEVILINDHSEDATLANATMFTQNLPFVRVFDLPGSVAGKKSALGFGINHSRFGIIATTDADCRFSKHWLSCVGSYYSEGATKMVTGGVKLSGGRSFFARLQKTEFVSLVGATAAAIGLGHPIMCNGANLSFRKEVFFEVNGYDDNLNIASGDDEFLMRKVHARYPGGIRFLNYYEAVVSSKPQSTLSDLFNQRLRWAGKWRHNSDKYTQLLAAFILISQASFVALIALNIFSMGSALTYIIVKIFLEGIFLTWVGRFLDRPIDVLSFLALQIVYPLYVIAVGVSSFFVPYTWKQRNYKQ